MDIAGVASTQGAYDPITTIYNAQVQAGTLLDAPAPRRDTVEISPEAQELSRRHREAVETGQAEEASASSSRDLPLEAYSLPQWYVELSSDLLQVDTRIGIPYSESRAARYDALSSQEKDDLAEYQGKLHAYFQEGLSELGIEGSQDYYARIVQDPEQSETLHQLVNDKLAGDQRALQLMDNFGISL